MHGGTASWLLSLKSLLSKRRKWSPTLGSCRMTFWKTTLPLSRIYYLDAAVVHFRHPHSHTAEDINEGEEQDSGVSLETRLTLHVILGSEDTFLQRASTCERSEFQIKGCACKHVAPQTVVLEGLCDFFGAQGRGGQARLSAASLSFPVFIV